MKYLAPVVIAAAVGCGGSAPVTSKAPSFGFHVIFRTE